MRSIQSKADAVQDRGYTRRGFLGSAALAAVAVGAATATATDLLDPQAAFASPTNLALNKRADALSQTSSAYPATNAVDGSTSTSWIANGASFPQWLVVDLGQICTLSSITQTFLDNTTWQYQLQASNTNLAADAGLTDYTVIVDHSAGVSGQTFTDTISNVNARYIRLYVTGAGGGHWAASQEFQVNGTVLTQPLNVVPTPVPLATGSLLVGVQACSLWGARYQWDRIAAFPDRLSLMGEYDEAYDVATDWQIKIASEHGISFFLPCWYRAADNAGKSPVMSVFDQFINSIANTSQYRSYMKWAIMWENSNAVASGATGVTDFISNVVAFWISEYFTKPNYLLIDNKPVVSIYDLSKFISDLGGQANATSAVSQMRSAATTAGFAGVYLMGVDDGGVGNSNATAAAIGFDYIYSYVTPVFSGLVTTSKPTDAQMIGWSTQSWTDYDSDGLPYIASVSSGWDTQPWRAFESTSTYYRLSAASFQTLLGDAKTYMSNHTSPALTARVCLIDNWNEYGEGHYINPSGANGFGYVDAVKTVFGTGGGTTDVAPAITSIPNLNSTVVTTNGVPYVLTDVNSTLVLDVAAGAGSTAEQHAWAGSTTQQWTINSLGNEQFQLVNVSSGLSLAIAGAGVTPGNTADQEVWTGALSQRWNIVSLGNGTFQLKNLNSGLFLGITSQNTNPGATADQDQWYGANSQKWLLQPIELYPPI